MVFAFVLFPLLLSGPLALSQRISGFFYRLNDKVRQPRPYSAPRRTKGDTIYVVNGKRMRNTAHLREVVAADRLAIDTVAVGMLTRRGRIKMILHYSEPR